MTISRIANNIGPQELLTWTLVAPLRTHQQAASNSFLSCWALPHSLPPPALNNHRVRCIAKDLIPWGPASLWSASGQPIGQSLVILPSRGPHLFLNPSSSNQHEVQAHDHQPADSRMQPPSYYLPTSHINTRKKHHPGGLNTNQAASHLLLLRTNPFNTP